MNGKRRARLLRAAIGRSGPVEPTAHDLGDWVTLATEERMIPLLYLVVVGSLPDVDDGELDHVADAQLDVMAASVRFEHDLLDVARAFADRIPFAVLKGLATAHLDYPDPSMRQFADVDLLVAPGDLAIAMEVLAELGWEQAYPLPRHHERFTHAITLRNARRAEIDLHQRVAHRALGERISTAALLRRRIEYAVAGQTLWALDDADRMVHACVHAATSRAPFRRMSSTADVLVLAEKHADTAADVLGRAASFHVGSIVRRAIGLAYDDARLTVPTAWLIAMSEPISLRDRLVDRAYLSERRRPITEEIAYLRLLRGWQNRIDYVSGYFTTDADYEQRNQRSGVRAQTKYLLSRLRSSDEPT